MILLRAHENSANYRDERQIYGDFPTLTYEKIGLIAMFGGFALTALAETIWPKYAWSLLERGRHLWRNLAVWTMVIGVASVGAIWFFTPLIDSIGRYQLGFLNIWHVPIWLAFAVGMLAADFSDYVLHRASHQWRALWLLHAVHHSDQHLDVSTSLRQHPLFFVVTMSLRVLMMVALGAPLDSLVVRDILGIVMSHLHHAAIAWTPAAVSRWQRWTGWLIVTPAAHWMHHDPDPALTNSNYGQILSIWDRLFGTFHAPALPTVDSGLDALRGSEWHTVRGMLMTPWRARGYDKF